MDCSQLQEINNYAKAVLNILDKELKTVYEIKSKIPQKVKAIKNEVYGYYRIIYESVFKKVFDEYYREYYDEQSLISSLIFISNNINIYPDIFYNSKKFRFLNFMERGQLDRGHNPSRVSTIDDFIDPDFELSYIGPFEEQVFANDSDAIQWESYYIDPIEEWNLSKQNNNVNTLALSPLEEVYKIALRRGQQEFLKQYNSSIKQKIEKKYNISL